MVEFPTKGWKNTTLNNFLQFFLELVRTEAGPILSVYFALIVHSELKSGPDFQWHLFFKHKLGLINK